MDELAPLLPHIDWFVPNDDEAERFTGHADPRQQLRALQKCGANTIIITRGGHGAVAARRKQMWECGAYRMNTVDPSGSGDAFTAGVITGIAREWDFPRTLRYASALGTSATRAVGTTDGVFTAAEAEAFVKANPFEVREIS